MARAIRTRKRRASSQSTRRREAARTSQGRPILSARYDLLHHLGREAARGQKARLARPPGGIGRARCRTCAPHRARARQFGDSQALRPLGRRARTMLCQLLLDAQVADSARGARGRATRRSARRSGSAGPPASRAALRPRSRRSARDASRPRQRALVGPVDVRARRAMPQQLAPQLGAAVLALRQPLQRARLQRQRAACRASSSLGRRRAGRSALRPPGSSGMPIDSRTLFSISSASSGFSRRNSRALSLPWPIFSPL